MVVVPNLPSEYCLTNLPWLDQIRLIIRDTFDGLALQARSDDVVRVKLVKRMMATPRLGDSLASFADAQIAEFAEAINTLPIHLHQEVLGALIDAVRDNVEVHLEVQRADPERLFGEDQPEWVGEAAFVTTRTIYDSHGRRTRLVRLGLPLQMLNLLDSAFNPGS